MISGDTFDQCRIPRRGISSLVGVVCGCRLGMFTAGSLRAGAGGSLISGVRRLELLSLSLGADLGDYQPALGSPWSLQSAWPEVPSELRACANWEV